MNIKINNKCDYLLFDYIYCDEKQNWNTFQKWGMF